MNTQRRQAIKHMGMLMLGGNLLLQGCTDDSTQNKVAPGDSAKATDSAKSTSIVKPAKNLTAIRIAKDEWPAAPDGTLVGDGKTGGTKVRAEYTNGQLCCQELLMPPKTAGPPPHLHHELDEVMRVLEGTVSVLVGKEVVELKAGDWHVRPHGIVHTFWNASDQPAKLIDLYPNQDLISFFEDFLRMQKRLQKEGVSMQSAEFQKSNNELLQKFGIEMFPEQFPAILQKYGLRDPFA